MSFNYPKTLKVTYENIFLETYLCILVFVQVVSYQFKFVGKTSDTVGYHAIGCCLIQI